MEDAKFYYFPYAEYTGKENMAIDHHLASQFQNYHYPIIRFYGWKPHCLSLGFHQKESDVLKEKIWQDNYDLIRRPTGGRAIFHSNELTYSLIFPKELLPRRELYQKSHACFSSVINELGIDSTLADKNPEFKQIYKQKDNFSCFASSAQFEINQNKKKMIGSAQRIYPNAILQHGSIMLGQEHLKLIDYLNIKPYHRREFQLKLKESTSFLELKRMSLSKTDLIRHFLKSFETKFHIETFETLELNVDKLEYGI